MLTIAAALLGVVLGLGALLLICWALFGGGSDKDGAGAKLRSKYDVDDEWA